MHTMTCPVCKGRTLDDHCPGSSVCSWHQCKAPECRATLDLDRRRGYQPNPENKAQTIALTL